MNGAIVFAVAAMASVLAPVEVTMPGPEGPLAGGYQSAQSGGAKGPVVVIIPGSGPTDRDGNSPLGIKAQPYRLLAEALSQRGIASLRIDKRGMFKSRAAIADANDVTIEDYAQDARSWAQVAAKRAGVKCAWLVGHSEGGLVALQAAQQRKGICGIVLVAAAGRPLGAVMREQFKANPANAPILPQALALIDALEAGRTVVPETLPTPLNLIFPVPVQRYLISTFRLDPAALAASSKVPVIVLQGDNDLQVTLADAERLKAARAGARLTILPGVNHVLKQVKSGDRAANYASYADPSLPIATSAVDAVVAAVSRRSK
ncbi:MAG: alpha/beta hydrolase [Novosphingobium sp.]|nr:alpha/beta hydrolase [Novosphingobium sp.]MBX9642622.1 lysophospholipase [Novosphingobium sp.]